MLVTHISSCVLHLRQKCLRQNEQNNDDLYFIHCLLKKGLPKKTLYRYVLRMRKNTFESNLVCLYNSNFQMIKFYLGQQ